MSDLRLDKLEANVPKERAANRGLDGMELRVEFSEELDRYQVWRKPPVEQARVTAFNLFRLPDQFMANVIFEDSEHIFPYLFCPVRLAGSDATVVLPACLKGVSTGDGWLEELVYRLRSGGANLGLQSTVSVVDSASFIAWFVGQSRNPYRTPYVGLTDLNTQWKSWVIYSYFSRQLAASAASIIDVGCGSGYGAYLLTHHDAAVCGIDTDKLAIEFARRLPRTASVSFELVTPEAVLERISGAKAIILSEVLEHVDNPARFLGDILSSVSPNCRVGLSIPMWRFHGIDLNSDHRTNWTITKAQRFLQRLAHVIDAAIVAYKPDPRLYGIGFLGSGEPEHGVFIISTDRHAVQKTCPEKRLSVLLVCHGIPPYEYTGTPIRTWQLARALATLGVQVTIMTTGNVDGIRQETLDGIPTYILPRMDPLGNFMENAFATDRSLLAPFERVLAQCLPDVVDFIDYVFMPAQVVQLASDYGAVVVRHVCNDEEICARTSPVIEERQVVCSGPESPEKCIRCINGSGPDMNDIFSLRSDAVGLAKIYAHNRLVQYLYGRVIDAVVFSSRSYMDHFCRFIPLASKKVYLINEGVAKSIPLARRNPDRNTVVFGLLGNIAFLKGQTMLLRAMARIQRKDFTVKLYGAASDPKILAGLRADPRIRYMGEFRSQDLPTILAQIDVGIVPSYFETYGRVLREFLSFGIPVIATRFFGSEIIEDGKNGFLVDIGDDRALADKMMEVLESAELVSRLRAGAQRTKVETPEGEAKRLLTLYRDLVAHQWTCSQHREAESVAMSAASNLQEIVESAGYNGANENRNESDDRPAVSG